MTPRPQKPPFTSARGRIQPAPILARPRDLSLCLAASCVLLLASLALGSPQSAPSPSSSPSPSPSSSASQQRQQEAADKQLLRKALDESLAGAGGNASSSNFQCPEQFGYYTDTRDCTKYYVCVFGEVLHESCTGGLRFSRELQTCDWPRNVNCPQSAGPANASAAAAAASSGAGRPSPGGQQGQAGAGDEPKPGSSSLVFADEGSDPQQPSFDEAVAPVITPDGSIHLHDGSGGAYGLSEQHNRAATAASDRQGERGAQLDVFVKPLAGQQPARPKPKAASAGPQPASSLAPPRQLQAATLPAQRATPATSVNGLSHGGQRQSPAPGPPSSTNPADQDEGPADGETGAPDSESGGGGESGEEPATTTDPSLGARAEREEAAEAGELGGELGVELGGDLGGDLDAPTSPRPPSTTGYVPPVLAPPPQAFQRNQAAGSQLLGVGSSRQTFNSDELLLNSNGGAGDDQPEDEHEPGPMAAQAPRPGQAPARPQPQPQNSHRQSGSHNQTVRQSRMSSGFQQPQQQLGPNRFTSLPPSDLSNNVNFNDSSKLIRLQASQFVGLDSSLASNGGHLAKPQPQPARSQNVLFSQQLPFGFSETGNHHQQAPGGQANQRPAGAQATGDESSATSSLQQQQRRPRPPKRQQIPSGNQAGRARAGSAGRPQSFFPAPQEEPTTSSPQQPAAATTAATTSFLLPATSFLESDARPAPRQQQQFSGGGGGGGSATTPPAPRQRSHQGGNLQSQGQPPRQLIVATTSAAAAPTNADQNLNLNSNPIAIANPSSSSSSNSNANQNQNQNQHPNPRHSQRQQQHSHSHSHSHSHHQHPHQQHHQQQKAAAGNPTSATTNNNNLATAPLPTTAAGQQQEQDPQLVANRYLSSAIDALEAGQPFGTVDYDFDILNDNSTERRQPPSSSLPAATGLRRPRPTGAQSRSPPAQSGGSNQTLLLFNSNANANKQKQQSFPVRPTSGGDEEGDSISLTNGQPTTLAGQVNSRQFGPPAAHQRQASPAPEPEQPQPQPQPQPQEQAGNGNKQAQARKARPTNKKIAVNHEQALANTRASAEPARRPESLFATPAALQPAGKCDARACRLPDCKCGDTQTPGGLEPKQIPQVVLLTFDDAVNDLNWEIYEELFTGRLNPNGCPILATFYVSHEWTDYGQVQTLYSRGHEMASHSITHSFGEKFSKSQWAKEINGQREILNMYGGVRMQDVRGMRAPFLQIGGNKMFEMLYDANFTYDSSMPIFDNSPPLWPYTLDYQLAHECMITPCPTKSFPGVWEVGMTMWVDLRGGRCSMGDACSNPPDEDGVYEMLMKNFNRHYKSNRAPFGLFYHSAWFNTVHHRRGFLRFMGQVNSLSDVFFVTNWQMLQWMRKPTPIGEINSFEPWQCPAKSDRPPPCFHPAVCNVKSEHGTRFMKTCQPCPANQQYPWVGATGFKAKQSSGSG